MCIAVGNVSLEDWPRFTSSFGWTGVFEPTSPPASWIARLPMTSFAFMFDLRAGARLPHDERELVVELALDHLVGGLRDQIDLLGRELAELAVGQRGRLLQEAQGPDHRRPHTNRSRPIGKFSIERCVCAPHSLSAGTRTSPRLSLSTLYSSVMPQS